MRCFHFLSAYHCIASILIFATYWNVLLSSNDIRLISFLDDNNIYAFDHHTNRKIFNVFSAHQKNWILDTLNQKKIDFSNVFDDRFLLCKAISDDTVTFTSPTIKAIWLIDLFYAKLPLSFSNFCNNMTAVPGIFLIPEIKQNYSLVDYRFDILHDHHSLQLILLQHCMARPEKYRSRYLFSKDRIIKCDSIDCEQFYSKNEDSNALNNLCYRAILNQCTNFHKPQPVKQNCIIRNSEICIDNKTIVKNLPKEFGYEIFRHGKNEKFYVIKSFVETLDALWYSNRELYYRFKNYTDISNPLLYFYDISQKKLLDYSIFSRPSFLFRNHEDLKENNISQTLLSNNGRFLCVAFENTTLQINDIHTTYGVKTMGDIYLTEYPTRLPCEGILSSEPNSILDNKICYYRCGRPIRTLLDSTFIIPHSVRYLHQGYIEGKIETFYKRIKDIFRFHYGYPMYGEHPDRHQARHYSLMIYDPICHSYHFDRIVDHSDNGSWIVCCIKENVTYDANKKLENQKAIRFIECFRGTPVKISYTGHLFDIFLQIDLILEDVMTVRFLSPDRLVAAGIKDGTFFVSLYLILRDQNRIPHTKEVCHLFKADVDSILTCQIGDNAEYIFVQKTDGSTCTYTAPMLHQKFQNGTTEEVSSNQTLDDTKDGADSFATVEMTNISNTNLITEDHPKTPVKNNITTSEVLQTHQNPKNDTVEGTNSNAENNHNISMNHENIFDQGVTDQNTTRYKSSKNFYQIIKKISVFAVLACFCYYSFKFFLKAYRIGDKKILDYFAFSKYRLLTKR